MSARRKISHPQLLSYLKFEVKYFNLKNNFYFNTQIFNSVTFHLLLMVACFILGFKKSIFWAFGIADALMVAFLYVKTFNFAQGISIVRKIPRMARENQEIEILYSISNETAFSLMDLEFTEEFDGVEKGQYTVRLEKPLKPHTQLQFIKKVILNAGMGVKVISPLSLNFEDDLGIFDFKIQFFQENQIEVYPSLEETPVLKSSVSPDSIQFGLYELAKRGDSNLFIGVRDYRHGDPVKHINWKLSQKYSKIVLNEFEKNTNTYVTLLLELDLGNQLGSGKYATWEKIKDLALSIATNEVRKQNLFQVVSNNMFLPFGSGTNHISTLEKHFTLHEMTNKEEASHLMYLGNLPPRGQIFYICPMLLTHKIKETLQFLKNLKTLGQEISLFVMDPYSELVSEMKGEMKLAILELKRQSEKEFEQLEKELRLMGISLTVVAANRESTLFSELNEKARQLLEVK